jgi:hypothetical protein
MPPGRQTEIYMFFGGNLVYLMRLLVLRMRHL